MEVKAGAHVRRTSVTLTTDVEGNATDEVGLLTGRLEAIVLIVPEENPLDSAGSITVTKVETGELVAEGSVQDFLPEGSINAPATVMAGESLSVVIENAGDSTSGTIYVYWS